MLYLFRVILTGIHLLRSGEVATDLLKLNESTLRFDFIDELVARKLEGKEKGRLEPGERDGLLAEAKKLESDMDRAAEESILPDDVGNRAALNDFLLRLRFEQKDPDVEIRGGA